MSGRAWAWLPCSRGNNMCMHEHVHVHACRGEPCVKFQVEIKKKALQDDEAFLTHAFDCLGGEKCTCNPRRIRPPPWPTRRGAPNPEPGAMTDGNASRPVHFLCLLSQPPPWRQPPQFITRTRAGTGAGPSSIRQVKIRTCM